MLNSKIFSAEHITRSRAYKIAKERAVRYRDDPEQLVDLIKTTSQKAQSQLTQRYQTLKESLVVILRLLRAYKSGEYREIPWASLSMLIAAVLYFLAPIDLVPDFLVAIGLIDDAALITWTMKTVNIDLDNFLTWEKNRCPPDNQSDDLRHFASPEDLKI